MSTNYRIGIDVGGTFTHAVAIDADALELAAKVRTPTTHRAPEGVARGVVDALRLVLAQAGVTPDQVRLVAHSTTQATNALLEGDVATVGILGMGRGLGAWPARSQTSIRPIPLGAGRTLTTCHEFLHGDAVNERTSRAAIERLRDRGAEVIVAADAFSVDDPTREQLVCRVAEDLGLRATATHVVSGLHGLAMRTRTAVVNASMMPKMLLTAEMTEQAVREAGIVAPLMVMRSDGGVMSLAEMRERPILTMLSGPAAGVAAALLYAQVSDGVFLEVGGTSTDISVIRHGRAVIRGAEIGGHRLSLSTLDVRTIGVAGGSLVRADGSRLGPRSAHLAGLSYVSFADPPPRDWQATTETVDGQPYLAMRGEPDSVGLAVTPTCAANRLGLIPPGDPAAGNRGSVDGAFDAIARAWRAADGAAVAEAVLSGACALIEPIVRGLIAEYGQLPSTVRLVGGGGGAAAIVPFLARRMGVNHELVPDADVISAIGVALAMIREVVERSAVEPGQAELCAVREEAAARVLRMGAAPETIEVFVEVDRRRSLIRATAEGALEIRRPVDRRRVLDDADRRELVAGSLGKDCDPPVRSAVAGGFEIWSAARRRRGWWSWSASGRRAVRLLDGAGTIRWTAEAADWEVGEVQQAGRHLAGLVARHTRYSDAGVTIPACFVLVSGHIIDLSGLASVDQAAAVLELELTRNDAAASCGVLVRLR